MMDRSRSAERALARRRLLAPLLLALAFAFAGSEHATAADPVWRLEQPPPPAGVPFSTALGDPGDIAFWAPNRGLMTVNGNDTIPRGVYNYDGTRWRQLATVCGGPGDTSRIAWAGPREFWVVSVPSAPRGGSGLALCRFKDGEVVGSWSTRIDSADPFRQMMSAACNGPDDCWFGGIGSQDALGERIGAFHLHWDGTSLQTVYGPQGRGVTDMEFFDGRLFETTLVGRSPENRSDLVQLAEPEPTPSLIHEITAGPTFTNDPFVPAPIAGVPSDGTELLALDADADNLWAVGGGAASGPSAPAGGVVDRQPVIARWVGGSFQEVTPDVTFAPGTRFTDVAAIPGTDAAWVTVVPFAERRSTNVKATVARIEADGTTTLYRLPVAGGGRGSAARIACTTATECWMATRAGWVFHLTDGFQWFQDPDPIFQSTIDFRPNEAAEQIIADTPPDDDSEIFKPPPNEPEQKPPRPKKLLKQIDSKLQGMRLVISFYVVRPAKIGLIAKKGKRVVGKTPMRKFRPGRGKLGIRVTRKNYPNKLAFKIKELTKQGGDDGEDPPEDEGG